MAKKLTVNQKRWLVSIHILFTIIWLGTSICFVVLNITAMTIQDSRVLHTLYSMIEVLDRTLIWGPSFGTIASGLLLSLLTQWGLIRFYWIVVKEILSAIALVFGIAGLHTWLVSAFSMTAIENATQSAAYTTTVQIYLAGNIAEVALLAVIVIISVFRPWGQLRKPKKMPVQRPVKIPA